MTTQTPMIRILVVDDSTAIQDGLSSLLNAQPDSRVIGTAMDGQEAVDKATRLLPDMVIMDAQMPCMDGVEATRIIKAALPSVGVLSFSTFVDRVEECLASGSDGFLVKDCEPAELYSEIRRIQARSEAGVNLKQIAWTDPASNS